MGCNLVAKHRQLKTETLCLTPGITTLFSLSKFPLVLASSFPFERLCWDYYCDTSPQQLYTGNKHVALLCVILESHHHKPL